jgi:hypothetical protein
MTLSYPLSPYSKFVCRYLEHRQIELCFTDSKYEAMGLQLNGHVTCHIQNWIAYSCQNERGFVP